MVSLVAETERLRLTTWDDARWAEFLRVTNTPAVMRHLGGVGDAATMAAARERIEGFQRDHGHTFWAVERKSDDALLGFCGLKRTNSPGGEHLWGAMEIGWRFREDSWGQGFASEAARCSMELAFERFGAPFVIALTIAANLPSLKVMRRLGMRRAPHLDFADRRYPRGEGLDIVTLITREEWQAQR